MSQRYSYPHSPAFWMTGLFLGVCVIMGLTTSLAANEGVTVRLRNDSGDFLAVHWVHPSTKETTLMDNVEPNKTFTVNSYISHQFQVRQLPNEESGLCESPSDGAAEASGEQACRINYFEVTTSPEQNMIVRRGIEIENVEPTNLDVEDDATFLASIGRIVEEPTDVIEKCKATALEYMNKPNDPDLIAEVFKTLEYCIVKGVVPNLKLAKDELDFEQSLLFATSEAMENYTCGDAGLEESPDVRLEEWTSQQDKVVRSVRIKLDRPASRIHVIENFASPEECRATEEDAQDRLSVASTSDGKGGTKISLGRKAMQASIKPNFANLEDRIALLSSRVYEYANHVLDLNLTYVGQEPLMSIQYFGRGYNDWEPDRYTPHCDGKCDGRLHISGARAATMVIYCTIPEKGGLTNFQNANVHIKPSEGSAIFFSYIDPATNMSDDRLTQHSGCPVYEGEKKIVTQWIRYGVDAETTHDAFNTLNILKVEDGDQ